MRSCICTAAEGREKQQQGKAAVTAVAAVVVMLEYHFASDPRVSDCFGLQLCKVASHGLGAPFLSCILVNELGRRVSFLSVINE